jgi:uncharacterized membrane-anchored protein
MNFSDFNLYTVLKWFVIVLRWMLEWLCIIGAYQLGKDTGDVLVKELSRELLTLVAYTSALLLFIIASIIMFWGLRSLERFLDNQSIKKKLIIE